MRWLQRLLKTLRTGRLSKDISREVDFHLAERARDLESEGWTPDAARTEARRRFGNVTLTQELARDANVVVGVDTFRKDLRYAVRILASRPAHTAVVVATLALGIGANSALFTMLRSLNWAPPVGVRDDASLARIRPTRDGM